MANELIQAQFEQLEAIAQQFAERSQSIEQMRGALTQRTEALRGGGWEGEGSDAFYREMEALIFPAVMRLRDALGEANRATLQIIGIIQTGEEEAAQPFRQQGGAFNVPFGGATGGGAVAGGGSAAGGSGDLTSGSATGGGSGATTGGGAVSTPTPISTNQVFADPYMESLIGSSYRGADSAELNSAMKTLAGNPSPAQVDQALDEIARLRGVPRDQIQAQYERFLDLKADSARIGAANDQPSINTLNDTFHGDFMGTTTQLRYGQVVGDALGIDPVFGSLLNPTGGLVGPGNYALDLGPDSPLSYHGIVHDAAGYLYNYHDMGPGYNYLGEEMRDTANPLTGQESGIRYWNEKLGAGNIETFVTNTGGTIAGELQDVGTWISETRRDIGEGVDDVKDWFVDLFD